MLSKAQSDVLNKKMKNRKHKPKHGFMVSVKGIGLSLDIRMQDDLDAEILRLFISAANKRADLTNNH